MLVKNDEFLTNSIAAIALSIFIASDGLGYDVFNDQMRAFSLFGDRQESDRAIAALYPVKTPS